MNRDRHSYFIRKILNVKSTGNQSNRIMELIEESYQLGAINALKSFKEEMNTLLESKVNVLQMLSIKEGQDVNSKEAKPIPSHCIGKSNGANGERAR